MIFIMLKTFQILNLHLHNNLKTIRLVISRILISLQHIYYLSKHFFLENFIHQNFLLILIKHKKCHISALTIARVNSTKNGMAYR